MQTRSRTGIGLLWEDLAKPHPHPRQHHLFRGGPVLLRPPSHTQTLALTRTLTPRPLVVCAPSPPLVCPPPPPTPTPASTIFSVVVLCCCVASVSVTRLMRLRRYRRMAVGNPHLQFVIMGRHHVPALITAPAGLSRSAVAAIPTVTYKSRTLSGEGAGACVYCCSNVVAVLAGD